MTSSQIDFAAAQIRLREIKDADFLYPWQMHIFAYGALSFASALMYFGGSWRDGCFAFFFGVLMWACAEISRRYAGVPEIEHFITSFVVTALAGLLDKFVFNRGLCMFAVTFGGLVWLLPGFSITISALEIYSKMIVYGSSRYDLMGFFMSM
jgi:uncharacterized membrane protein YjjP (DUF1212 family)